MHSRPSQRRPQRASASLVGAGLCGNSTCRPLAWPLACVLLQATACQTGAAPTQSPEAFTRWCLGLARAEQVLPEATYAEPLALELANGTVVGLSRPWEFCQRVPADCRAMVVEYLRKTDLSVAEQTTAGPGRHTQLRPALRSGIDVQTYRTNVAAAVIEPFLPGIEIVYMFDLPDAAAVVVQEDLSRLDLKGAALRKAAIANLENELARLRKVTAELGDQRRGVVEAGYYTSSLLLVPEAWGSLAARFGGHLLVSAPGPHSVLFADGREPAAALEIAHEARDLAAASQRPLSSAVFRWQPSGWAPTAQRE